MVQAVGVGTAASPKSGTTSQASAGCAIAGSLARLRQKPKACRGRTAKARIGARSRSTRGTRDGSQAIQ